jgi:NAD(P)-dependent dehydrogenase (short-subunit alcohol dehydrogenase family)
MNGKLLLLGGSGGLGQKLQNETSIKNDYLVLSTNSKNCDIRDRQTVKQVIQDFEPDYIINLAAYSYNGFIHKQLDSEIDKQISVNVNGVINIVAESVEYFRKKNTGKIILLSSIVATRPVVGAGIYSASKAFVENLCKTIALENAKYHITCNSIQLGYFDAGLIFTIPEDVRNAIITSIPLKRLGRIDELYKTIQYIFSVDYLTGASIALTGGL